MAIRAAPRLPACIPSPCPTVPSGAIPARRPSRSTAATCSIAAQSPRPRFSGTWCVARTAHPTNVRSKSWASTRNRTGRPRLPAPIATIIGSSTLTWLYVSSAPPSSGMCSSPSNRMRNPARNRASKPSRPTHVQPSHSERIGSNGKLRAAMGTYLTPELPLARVSAPVIGLRELVADEPIDEPTPSDPNAFALLQFTSGTTAGSRAVSLTHRHVLTNLAAAVYQLDAHLPRAVFVSWLPLFHDMGLIGMLLGSIASTCPFVVIPPEEFMGRPGSWMDAVSRYRGTLSASPHFAYGLAARDLRLRPRELDLWCFTSAGSGAEAIDHDTVESFTREAGKYGFTPERVCPMYGLAENMLAVSIKKQGTPVIISW